MSTYQNIFGRNMPKIYIDGTEYQLPQASRNGREENFAKVAVNWTDLNRYTHERIKGYRLRCRYSFEYLINDDFETLLTIYNAASATTSVSLKFDVIPRQYPVRVVNFEHSLAGGLASRDAASIEFEGKNIVKNFPNPDNIYTLLPTSLIGKIIVAN